jgi:hypothetical protein
MANICSAYLLLGENWVIGIGPLFSNLYIFDIGQLHFPGGRH